MQPTIKVDTAVNVTWLAGQTKGSAEIEITFGGVAVSEPIHIGFAVQQLAQARAAAEVLASFFMLLARDIALRTDDRDYEVALGDAGSGVTFEVQANLRPVTAFQLTVPVGDDCNTRTDAAEEAAATLIEAIDRFVEERAELTDEAMIRLQPVKSYYPEVLHLAIERVHAL
jgi:hypothetical protein